MSNVYGFDFLRSGHNDTAAHAPPAEPPSPSLNGFLTTAVEVPPDAAAAAAEKTDLEKQFDVIHFLQTHRTSGCLAPSVIYKSTGIDLSADGIDEMVAKMLLKNPKIRVEEIPDPEDPTLTIQTFGYQAKFNNVRDRAGLLAQINRCKNGVGARDLLDAYDGVEEDLTALVTAGDVLAVANPEDKDRILFPRGEQFLVELDGHIALGDDLLEDLERASMEQQALINHQTALGAGMATGAMPPHLNYRQKMLAERTCLLNIDVDPRKQIRRGEAVCVGGAWFRLSSAVREGSLADQPARAQAPPSVTLRRDLSKKNEADGYVRPLTERCLPVDQPLLSESLRNLREAKAAKEQLHRVAGGMRGVTGGATAQLLSSNAGATNRGTLAVQFASTVAAAGTGGGHGPAGRRRPGAGGTGSAAASRGLGGGGVGGRGGHGHAANPAVAAAQRAAAIDMAKKAASDPALSYLHARRHGCTKDVRDMWFDTAADVPGSEEELYNLMVKQKLIEKGEPMRQPRMNKKNPNLDNDGKPKKRRYYERKNQRMTNVHLIGSEIGTILAKAAEKQQQGKSVGDGGM